MERSPELNELAAALAKAQAAIKGAAKDAENPHFKSKYADLASIWEACRSPLATNGLSIVQMPGYDAEGQIASLTTWLLHSSGQYMTSTAHAPVDKTNAQGIGSALTYLRRYALAAFVSVAPEDDDGEAAVDHEKPQRPNYANAEGEFILPGTKAKWGGHGGKPLSKVPDKPLAKALAWFEDNKGPEPLIAAMHGELERRQEAKADQEDGGYDKMPAPLEPQKDALPF